ncbi:MAG: hypothetical protein J1F40_05915 [Prevotellaceae bacterium]|nr:hypothetical protein [Prevotellaceae bacterium]
MKTLRNLLTAVVILCGTLTMNAQSMSITAIRSNARFLTDRMAYTLGIRDPFLIDEIYRINYDYIYGVNTYLDEIALGYYYDDYMLVCNARDIALRNLLGITIWNRLVGYSYFHRPIIFSNHRWHFGIYDHDRFGINHFHYAAPRPFGNGYAGGHFFGGMAPRGGRGNAAPPPAPNRPNNAAPSAPRGNSGRGNATPPAPNGGSNSGRGEAMVGGRSQSNIQSSSRAGGYAPSASNPSRTRSGAGMNATRTNAGSSSAGRGGAGATRSSAGGSRGGGRR